MWWSIQNTIQYSTISMFLSIIMSMLTRLISAGILTIYICDAGSSKKVVELSTFQLPRRNIHTRSEQRSRHAVLRCTHDVARKTAVLSTVPAVLHCTTLYCTAPYRTVTLNTILVSVQRTPVWWASPPAPSFCCGVVAFFVYPRFNS